jgi:hypothetical protein
MEKCDMSFKQPFEVSMKRFRETVEAIEEEPLRIKMEIGYLLAARNCEMVTKVSEKEILNHSSRNYGIFMDFKFQDYVVQPTDPTGIALGLKQPFSQKVMVIHVATAKRGKRVRKETDAANITEVKPEEVEKALTTYRQFEALKKWRAGELTIDPLLVKVLNGDIYLRYVALPCSLQYEPWIRDLLGWVQKHPQEKLSIPITRRTFWYLYRKALKDILPPKHEHGKDSLKNPLRHLRVSHLLQYYGLTPYEINAYTGWSLSGIFAQLGQVISSNLELYSHLSWRMYLPKLCVPINRFIG